MWAVRPEARAASAAPGAVTAGVPVTCAFARPRPRPLAAVASTAVVALAAEGVAVTEVGLRRPTLDDVFLTLTGQVS